MVSLIILLFAIIVIGTVLVVTLGAGGIVLFMVFGDVLIAGVVIYLIIRAITKNKN